MRPPRSTVPAGTKRLIYVTFPLLANVYLISTLLSTVWTLGDFPTVYFVSSGAPGMHNRCAGHLRLPRGVRFRLPEPRRGGDDVGAADAHPAGDPVDAARPGDGGAAMSIALTLGPSAIRPRYRRRRLLAKAAAIMLGVVAADLDAAAGLQHDADRARFRCRRVHRQHLAARSRLLQLPLGLERRLLADGAFLAPVRQQHLPGRGDDGADRADRLARQLRAGPLAVAQGLDRHATSRC